MIFPSMKVTCGVTINLLASRAKGFLGTASEMEIRPLKSHINSPGRLQTLSECHILRSPDTPICSKVGDNELLVVRQGIPRKKDRPSKYQSRMILTSVSRRHV